MKREPRAFIYPRSCQARHGCRGRNDRCGFQIEKHWKTLFEVLLEEWIVDESLWPEKRTLKLFREWFEPIYCGMVWNLARDPLEIEDWEAVAAEHMRVH
jgi:hypothetical protein